MKLSSLFLATIFAVAVIAVLLMVLGVNFRPPLPAQGAALYNPAISNNVGVVNYFFRTLLHALREERHFALVEKIANIHHQGSRVISRTEHQSDPTISPVATSIMITTSNSLERERAAQSMRR